MHRHIIHNRRLLEGTKARLPAVTSATLEGRGVYTTLAVYHARAFLWPQHWTRLAEHAERAGVSLEGFDETTIGASLARLVKANKVQQGRARVLLLARASRGAWAATMPTTPRPQATATTSTTPTGEREETATDLLILTADARAPSTEGLALTVSPYRANTHSPLAGVKSISRLEHLLAFEEARARDFDEAVVLNERGEIVSATSANIFWVTNGTLHTPSLASGAIAGTTRALTIELATELAFPHVEGVYDLAQLGDADEIFLTSSSLSIEIVTSFDFHRYTVPVGSVALRLREAFRQFTLHAG